MAQSAWERGMGFPCRPDAEDAGPHDPAPTAERYPPGGSDGIARSARKPCRARPRLAPKPTVSYIRNGYNRHGATMADSTDPQALLPLTPVVLHILLSIADDRTGKHGY